MERKNKMSVEEIRQALGIKKPESKQNVPVKKQSQQKEIFPLVLRPNIGAQIVLGNVPSKSNCYKIITINGHPSLGKTSDLKKYEEMFFIQCHKYRNANIEGYFEFHMKVFYQSQRSDLDNSLKVVLDCLQKIKAIKNDNRCVKLVIDKFLDKDLPRIEFEIIER